MALKVHRPMAPARWEAQTLVGSQASSRRLGSTGSPEPDNSPTIGETAGEMTCGKPRQKSRAFSLIETVLAIGVVAFAFVPLFGLLPVGLTTFRQAIDTTLGSQIMQQMINDAQQTNFSTLTATTSSMRYFDDQGIDVTAAPTAYLYVAQMSVSVPTTLPGSTVPSAGLATVTVKFAVNPSHNPSPFTGNKVPYITQSTVVAKNQ